MSGNSFNSGNFRFFKFMYILTPFSEMYKRDILDLYMFVMYFVDLLTVFIYLFIFFDIKYEPSITLFCFFYSLFQEYTIKQMLALVNAVDHLNKKAKQRLVNMLEDMDKPRR